MTANGLSPARVMAVRHPHAPTLAPAAGVVHRHEVPGQGRPGGGRQG